MSHFQILAISFIDGIKMLLDEIRRMSARTYIVLFIIAVLIILVPMEIR